MGDRKEGTIDGGEEDRRWLRPMHLDSIEKPFLGELRQKLRCDVPLALRDSTCHRNHLLQIEKKIHSQRQGIERALSEPSWGMG